MPLSVSYMGTKRQLAPAVAEVVSRCPGGPILDAFSGMCAITSAVGPARQVWTNDLQYFAHAVAHAHFCSQQVPPSRSRAALAVRKHYSAHVNAHLKIAALRVADEESALRQEDHDFLREIYAEWQTEPALSGWVECPSQDATLFRDTFSGSYFALVQAIEIDALRFGVDAAYSASHINADEHRWLLLALCVALSKCSASTGHFAQPLTPKLSNIKRFKKQRSKPIWDNWLSAVEALRPLGTAGWRSFNRAMRGDALETLQKLRNEGAQPAVIYADPPYTTDQYSRYYHVYDTLLRYDYPDAQGRGRYRPDRAVSAFSLASKVASSLEDLVENCSRLGADLILSYPTNGLLAGSRDEIPSLIKRIYGRGPEVTEINHHHSTMGGSKGPVSQAVIEVVYRAYH